MWWIHPQVVPDFQAKSIETPISEVLSARMLLAVLYIDIFRIVEFACFKALLSHIQLQNV